MACVCGLVVCASEGVGVYSPGSRPANAIVWLPASHCTHVQDEALARSFRHRKPAGREGSDCMLPRGTCGVLHPFGWQPNLYHKASCSACCAMALAGVKDPPEVVHMDCSNCLRAHETSWWRCRCLYSEGSCTASCPYSLQYIGQGLTWGCVQHQVVAAGGVVAGDCLSCEAVAWHQ